MVCSSYKRHEMCIVSTHERGGVTCTVVYVIYICMLKLQISSRLYPLTSIQHITSAHIWDRTTLPSCCNPPAASSSPLLCNTTTPRVGENSCFGVRLFLDPSSIFGGRYSSCPHQLWKKTQAHLSDGQQSSLGSANWWKAV